MNILNFIIVIDINNRVGERSRFQIVIIAYLYLSLLLFASLSLPFCISFSLPQSIFRSASLPLLSQSLTVYLFSSLPPSLCLSLSLSSSLPLSLFISFSHSLCLSQFLTLSFSLSFSLSSLSTVLYRDIVPHNPFESFGYRHVFREWYENNKGENTTQN